MDRQPTKLELTLMLVTSLATAAAAVWAEMSPAQRELTLMSVKAGMRRFFHRAALRAGRAGMGGELAGHGETAAAGYGLAYRLAVLRDRL